jgi:hypothetical protein
MPPPPRSRPPPPQRLPPARSRWCCPQQQRRRQHQQQQQRRPQQLRLPPRQLKSIHQNSEGRGGEEPSTHLVRPGIRRVLLHALPFHPYSESTSPPYSRPLPPPPVPNAVTAPRPPSPPAFLLQYFIRSAAVCCYTFLCRRTLMSIGCWVLFCRGFHWRRRQGRTLHRQQQRLGFRRMPNPFPTSCKPAPHANTHLTVGCGPGGQTAKGSGPTSSRPNAKQAIFEVPHLTLIHAATPLSASLLPVFRHPWAVLTKILPPLLSSVPHHTMDLHLHHTPELCTAKSGRCVH